MSRESIEWHGRVLQPDPEEPHMWSYDSDRDGREEDALELWVSVEDSGEFSASVVLGFIEGDGVGRSASEALDQAMKSVLQHIAWAHGAAQRILV